VLGRPRGTQLLGIGKLLPVRRERRQGGREAGGREGKLPGLGGGKFLANPLALLLGRVFEGREHVGDVFEIGPEGQVGFVVEGGAPDLDQGGAAGLVGCGLCVWSFV
jgi:hypothetical protein